MGTIPTKFAVNDLCYTFDNVNGVIHRSVVKEISATLKNNDLEVLYTLVNTTPALVSKVNAAPEYEQNTHTEDEVKELANIWLINKSVSIFSSAGL